MSSETEKLDCLYNGLETKDYLKQVDFFKNNTPKCRLWQKLKMKLGIL